MVVVHIISILIFLYLLLSIAYILVLATAGRFGKINQYQSSNEKASIAVIIPSYKEDNIIVQTAMSALQVDYPRHLFTVTVIADKLQPETIQLLKSIPVNVVEVSFEKSMKARSIHTAFNQFPVATYDLAMILDADNIMADDCLQKVNDAWQQGWKVIQCHRTAKNRNTPVAVLDALSEEVNNTIFRRGQRAVGLSCALIGSGMAFQFELLQNIFALPQILDNAGEDREVDVQLVKQNVVVEYIENAFVYDEKVQRAEVFEKQRTRWIATQVDHFKRFLAKDVRNKFGEKIYTHKLLQCLLLPRLLMLLSFMLITAIALLDYFIPVSILFPSFIWWLIVMGLYFTTLAIAIPRSFYNRDTFKALIKIPALMLAMVKALLKIGKSRKEFLHTPKEFPG